MSQVCSKCSHANPSEASYCYYDGAVLGGHGVNGGPVNAGSAPFPNPFVFPTGQQCRNFDQLAMACQEHWKSAVDLLRQGFLSSFMGGIGRVDLAMAAQEAARFPDIDRGLDQLLDKLPSQVLQKPRLAAEPSDINLGVIPVGPDRNFELHLTNQGMRLLYGSVVSDCKWLTLGEGQGNAQKLFQFGADGTVPVQVRGQHLRAGNKPLEGHLVIESNGGQATITVRAEVPVKPFQGGVLAGAISPRQVAEKAKAHPKEAAPLFEQGAVASWFSQNGWTYPVQGPSASGLGAVQQFFEALGLATAPKVELTQKAIALQGNVGQPLEAVIEVKTQEKRPVYAHATCDQLWVDVSQTTLNGRIATIAVRVPAVPPRSGETLTANIHVQANGNQRFTVPLTLTITGTGGYPVLPVTQPAYPPPVQPAYAPVVQPAYGQPAMVQPVNAQPVYAQPAMVQPVAPRGGNVFDFDAPPVAAGPAAVPYVTAQPAVAMPVGVTAAPMMPGAQYPAPAPAAPRPPREKTSNWVHLAPAGVLLLVLLILIVRDLIKRPSGGTSGAGGVEVDHTLRVKDYFADGGVDEVGQQLDTSMRFGVVTLDPKTGGSKKLTFDRHGRTNTTVVRIDGNDQVFGAGAGRWETVKGQKGVAHVGKNQWDAPKTECTWMHNENIQITQIVEVVPGEPIELPDGSFKRMMDTTLVRYQIENKDSKAHRVGLRLMLDTLIGMTPEGAPNDGVPFTVPGLPGLVDTCRDFAPPDRLPDFIQVLEKPNLKNPGLIALINLKVGQKVEPPDRVSLTAWPGRSLIWEVPVRPMGQDSAVVFYWNERELQPGGKREVGFAYGLGSVSSASGKLGLSVGGNFTPGGELTVIALVGDAQPGQKVKLKLPTGFTLVDGNAEQDVPQGVGGRPAPVTWRVRSTEAGTFDLEVTSGGAMQKKRVNIKTETIF